MRNFNDLEYKKWRKDVRKRDGYHCKWPHCDKTKGIQVHHILPWSQYPGLRYHINNGVCLCKFHHKLIQNDETSYSQYFLNLLMSHNSGKSST